MNFLIVKAEHETGEGIEKKEFYQWKNALRYFAELKQSGVSKTISNEETGKPEKLTFISLYDRSGNIYYSHYFKKLTENEVMGRTFNIYKKQNPSDGQNEGLR